MKRRTVLILSAVLILVLAGCGGPRPAETPSADVPQTAAPQTEAPQTEAPQTAAPQTAPPAPADRSPLEIAEAVVAATGRKTDELIDSCAPYEGETLLGYVEDKYGLTLAGPEDVAVFTGEYIELYEIAVFRFESEKDASAAADTLTAYLADMEEGLVNYAPDRIPLVQDSLGVSSGRYAALLLCEGADEAELAFYDAVNG